MKILPCASAGRKKNSVLTVPEEYFLQKKQMENRRYGLFEGDRMIIAISANQSTMEGPVNPRFGRANGFVVYNTDTGETRFLDNTKHQALSQGAGIQAARMVADAGAEALITGQIGPKALQVLKHANIPVYYCGSGSMKEAVEACMNNLLKPISEDGLQTGPGKAGGRGMGGGGRGQGGRGMGGGCGRR